MKLRTLGLAAALTGAALVTQASSCNVQVGPPIPKVVALHVCYVPGSFQVFYTYEVFGNGWYRLRSASGITGETYFRYGEIFQAYGIGDSYVEWTADLDDDHEIWVTAVGGYRPAQPTPDCLQTAVAR